MKKVMTFLAALLLLASACKKTSHESPEQTGRIRWGGDPAVDGLGYYIVMDSAGVLFHPKELGEWFKHDSMRVAIRYTLTGQIYPEQYLNTGIKTIDIKTIRTL